MIANTMSSTASKFLVRRTTGKFVGDRRGLAAIEFALLLPVMLLLYLGAVEVEEAIAADRLVGLTASTVTSLVTQYTTISASQQMPDILNASTAVMYPFSGGQVTVVVSCINVDATGRATIAWSQALNGSARTVGQVVTLPTAFDVPNTSVIFGETAMAYTPVIDFLNFGTLHPQASLYMSPRSSSTITLTS